MPLFYRSGDRISIDVSVTACTKGSIDHTLFVAFVHAPHAQQKDRVLKDFFSSQVRVLFLLSCVCVRARHAFSCSAWPKILLNKGHG